jgi:SAM-dependent methyltransferase
MPGVSVVADLVQPLPFASGTFDEVWSSHVLEHVDRLLPLLAELARITRPGGRLRLTVPHFSFFGAYTDPTHRRFFGFHSFDYFTVDGTYNFYTPLRFRIVEREIRFFWWNNERQRVKSRLISWLINRVPLFYERFACWLLPANELYCELEVVPRGVEPGAPAPPPGDPATTAASSAS